MYFIYLLSNSLCTCWVMYFVCVAINMKYDIYLRQDMPISIKSSIISKIMQTEKPTQTPMEPPRVEMKVTRV